MTTIRNLIIALALLCGGPALAQQQGEFDLPERGAPTPAGGGQVQGPVDDSGIVPIGPRVIRPAGTPTAAPTAAPTATPTARPTTPPATRTATQPATRPTATRPTAARPAQAPASRATPELRPQPPVPDVPTPSPTLDGPSITDPIAPGDSPAADGSGTDTAVTSLPTAPGPVEAQTGPASPAGFNWWWIVAALAGAAILAAAAFAIRRKQEEAPIVAAPKASPGLMPAAAPKPAPEPTAAAAAAVAEQEPGVGPETVSIPSPAFVPAAKPSPASGRTIAPLGLETQVTRMQRSLRAVTVTAKIAVTNRGTSPIVGAVLQGDLVGASKEMPLGEQLANAAHELEELEPLGTLAPGERREATVQVRRELPEIEGIRQGNTIVFIPLLRIRFAGDGATPLASTVLVGHPPERSGGKPTPFLADAPPQNYDNVVGRALG